MSMANSLACFSRTVCLPLRRHMHPMIVTIRTVRGVASSAFVIDFLCLAYRQQLREKSLPVGVLSWCWSNRFDSILFVLVANLASCLEATSSFRPSSRWYSYKWRNDGLNVLFSLLIFTKNELVFFLLLYPFLNFIYLECVCSYFNGY